jgi:uncharacterized membrane protein
MLVTSCIIIPARHPSNKYLVKVFQKKNPVGNPLIFGRTEELHTDGSYHPVILAYISLDNQGVKSSEDGTYSLSITPGKYDVSVRSIGYQPIVVKGMRIARNDSVMIDFHLVADTVKL